MQLVIAEKPSVAQSLAKVLGAATRKDGYLEGNGFLVSWCFGHLMPLHTGKGRTVGTAIEAIIDYVENPEKTDNGNLITSWQCDSRVADREFLFRSEERRVGKECGS